MNRQFANHAAHRAETEIVIHININIDININDSRVACLRPGKTVCGGKAQAGLSQPILDQRLEMLPAADALRVSLPGERRMPGEDLETIKPAVFDDQEPSRVAEDVEAADRARSALSDRIIHDNPS